jgi:hypothetical protein
MMRYLLAICFALLLTFPALGRAESVLQVSFDAIQGAKRFNRVNRTWELAIGKPPPLFPCSDLLVRDLEDMEVGRRETRILELPFWPRTDAEFTCTLEIETSGGGSMTMTHRNQRNSVVDQWDENFTGSGFVSFKCLWPYVVMDENEKYEARISLSSSRPVRLVAIYLYQTLDQVFRLNSGDPTRGIIYNRSTSGKEETLESIRGVRLTETSVPLITSKGGGLGYGVLMPVFAQNGCGVLWRLAGEASVIVKANAKSDEGKLYRRSFDIGRPDNAKWQTGFFMLDTGWLNRMDADGFWVGTLGEKSNLLASIRGENSLLDFVAFIPQNRINLPEKHQYKTMRFRYQAANGLYQLATLEIPPGSSAVALVNRNPGIQVLWLVENEWRLGAVLRAYLDSTLIVRENSIILVE